MPSSSLAKRLIPDGYMFACDVSLEGNLPSQKPRSVYAWPTEDVTNYGERPRSSRIGQFGR
jgi:hypothetical protein